MPKKKAPQGFRRGAGLEASMSVQCEGEDEEIRVFSEANNISCSALVVYGGGGCFHFFVKDERESVWVWQCPLLFPFLGNCASCVFAFCFFCDFFFFLFSDSVFGFFCNRSELTR